MFVLRCLAICALAQGLSTLPVCGQPLTAVVSDPGNITIQLEPVATLTGFIPIDAAAIPGDDKLYVGTYIAASASVRVVDPVSKTVSATPFLTFAGTGVPIVGQGLQGITFSPNFNDSAQPGYRKFYTYAVETGPGAANIMYAHPEVPGPGQVGVLREWTANALGTAIDTTIPSRVVINFGGNSNYTHSGGGMKFGPDGYLYVATGDSGGNGNGNSGAIDNAGDGFTGRNPTGTSSDVPAISNGVDFTNLLGKVIRIDPYVTNGDGSPRATPADTAAKTFGGSTRYFIPNSNPFVGNPQNIYFTPLGPAASQAPVAPLAELFAFGFRNPWKLSFDKNGVAGDAPYVADVGSRDREEIVLLESGKNYGWPYREGDVASPAAANRPLVAGNLPYLKQTSPGVFAPFDLDPTLSDPTQMAPPTAILATRSVSGGSFYDNPNRDVFNDGIYGDQYGDGTAVVGGFVYRGTSFPALEGKYVMGVYEYVVPASPGSYVATSVGGRLLYFDPAEEAAIKTVRAFNFTAGSSLPANGGGSLLSISEGNDGELYAMLANGSILKIAAPPLPGDYNNDHVVDAADYTVWRDNVGSSSALPNDPIGGTIGDQQYEQWKTNFGASDLGGSGSLGANVPEPGGLVLLAVGLMSSLVFGRRRFNAKS
jgi:hypothetical protein